MLSEEQLLPLSAAVEKATGQRPHPSTLHRWRIRGIAGVKLETVRCGGKRLCTVEAVRRFLEGVTFATDGEAAPSRTNRQRQRDIDRAETELEAAGI